MLTKKKLYFGFIVASLITATTVYLMTSVLLTSYRCCSLKPDITDDTTKNRNEHMLDHHPKTDPPLNNSVSPILPTTPKLALIHDSKPPKSVPSTVSHSKSSHTPTTSPRYGYIIVFQYSGWIGGGTGALLQLQCYVKMNDLPMQVVEPAVENSKFHAVLNERKLRFSDLFDISQYNRLLKQEKKYAPLSPWDDFVQNAPRNTIFVKLYVTSQTKPPQVEWQRGPRTANCNSPIQLTFLQIKGFCVVRIVSLFYSTSVPFTGEELRQNILGGWKPDEVTVVLSRWAYSYYIPIDNIMSRYTCRGSEWTGRKVLYPSERLLKDIRRYEKMFQNPQTSIAVLMHAERLITSLGKESESMIMKTADLHLKELLSVVKEFKTKFPNGTAFGAVDIGRFGSLTVPKAFSGFAKKYKSNLLESIQNTLTEVYDNKWTFSEWEDNFLQANGGIADTGYVGAIQRGVASRAKCLVLFGGGRFQFVALNEYIHNHPDKSDQCISYVFIADRFTKYYRKVVN